MLKVFVYRGTRNLGDAIQTYALCRLLGTQCAGVYRDEPFPDIAGNLPLVVNGWLGWGTDPKPSENCIFAGVHLAKNRAHYIDWLRRTGALIGARDPFTQKLLALRGVRSTFVGCTTLTLPRYDGPRSGRYSVDARPYPGVVSLSNWIEDLDWTAQWNLAMERIEQLRRAEVVYTNRLHVILPCLAFGTPVVFPKRELLHTRGFGRLSLLWALRFRFDREFVTDVSEAALRYRSFLEQELGKTLTPSNQVLMPAPLCPPGAPGQAAIG